MPKSIVTTEVLSVADFKKKCNTKGLAIVQSERTKKNYAKDDKGDIVASVSDSIDLKAELEVRHMHDEEAGESWYFLCNVTKYAELGSI